jgi:hypothetical protein
MMDFNVCKNTGFKYAVKGKKKGDPTTRDIPTSPKQETFILESSKEIVEIWVDDPAAPGNTPWIIRYKPTSPQSVNVTIGGDE